MNKKSIIFIIILVVALMVAAALLFRFNNFNSQVPARAQVVNKILPIQTSTPLDVIKSLPTTTIKTVSSTISVIFGGDVMLSRVVGQQLEKHHDYSWPFRFVSSTLRSADLTIVNLESPITIKGNHFVPTGSFSFNADPRAIDGLKLAGIDVVCLANNHFANQGARGMLDTFKVLENNGIGYVGAGRNFAQSHRPWIKEIKGLKIGFLAYAYPNDNSVASNSRPGINTMDIAIAKEDIEKLKGKVDLIIVIIHAGTEYTNQPNSQQKAFAHQVIEAGADMVVGHHPHWVQTTEVYLGRPIIYSLGNLIFDQMWSPETQQGALAQVDIINKKIKDIKILPLHIYDYGQPQISSSTLEQQEVLTRMGLSTDRIILAN